MRRPAGMMFKEARLENVGPIRQASIASHRLTVFVGPNNSGKSIASRLIHAARRLGTSSGPPAGPDGAAAVLRGAGIEWPDAVTRSMPSGRLELGAGNGAGGTVLNFGDGAAAGGAAPQPPCSDPAPAAEHGMYVPSGRTGIVQSFFTLLQARGDLADSLLRALAGRHGSGGAQPKALGTGPGTGRQMPEYLEQFYGIVLEALSRGLDRRTEEMFSRVFPGSIRSSKDAGPPEIVYVDPLGFEARVGPAASGVAAVLPIMVALNRVGPAGMLVVEEPEENVEPIRQLRLVDEIVRAALGRRISLVLTTHSDFVVHAVLGMVHSGAIDPADLGLYYFRRRRGSYTDVEQIPVNSAGEAEQELFDEALDALAKGSVIPVPP